MSAPWLIKKPTSPSQWDDEFDTSDIQSKWSMTNQAGGSFIAVDTLDPNNTSAETHHRYSHNKYRPSWLMVQPAVRAVSSSPTLNGFQQSLVGLPTDCFMYARVRRSERMGAISNGDGEIAMRIASADSSDYFLLWFDVSTNIDEGMVSRNVSNAFTNMGIVRNYFGRNNPLEYLGIQKIGNTFHGWLGTSGGNWVWGGSNTWGSNPFVTVNLEFNCVSSSSPGRMIVGYDFFRVFTGRGPL